MIDQMLSLSGRDIFLAAIKGEKTLRPAVFSVGQTGTYELMEKVSSYWPDAISDAKEMATLAAAAHTVAGLDAVRVPFCQTINAEIFGSTLKEGGRLNVPSIARHRYKIGEAPHFPEDFLKKGRIPQLLEAVRILKDTLGDSAAVIGGIIGPFSEAGNIVEVASLLVACMKNPDSIIPYLEAAERAGTMLGKALIAAGVDVICIEDMLASLDMISPNIFRKVALPWEIKQIQQLRDVPTILHICGRVDPVITDLVNSGATALSLDVKADVRAARAAVEMNGKKMPLIGGINCTRALLEMTPEGVSGQVREALDSGYEIIAPSCSIPPATPTENLLAMVKAVRETV